MKSIRVFLVIALIAIVTLANFIAAVRGYLGSMEEAERLFNQRLMQQVDLLNYTLPGLKQLPNQAQDLIRFPAKQLNTEASLEFQWVADNGQLLAKSAAMPDDVVAPLDAGFKSVNFNHYRWHVLVARSADNTSWYILAERDDQRYRLAESMVLQAVYPMVLAIPLIGLIIWLVLGFGLRPVVSLTRQLHQREATDLRPLVEQDMPVELIPLAQSANQLLRRLEASFAREKRFSADAAHELRTPVAALKIHCDNLLQALVSPPDSALKLQAGITRMSYLIEQVLLLNRTAPDQFMGKFEPINLTQLTKKIITEHSDELESKQHRIEFEGEESWILGDRPALETLVTNLLTNAIKYTPAGGHICVNTWLRGKEVVLEVMDNGPGIADDQRDRVFDRFYRVGGDRHQSQIPGCGLGLSIVKQVVDLHHAHIELTQSRFPQGLLVLVTFAAYQPPLTNNTKANNTKANNTNKQGRRSHE